MSGCPSQPNSQAEVQEALQPLQSSAQQAPPSPLLVPQAVASLGATGSGENLSQDNATVTNELNLTENLEVFFSFQYCTFVGCYTFRLRLFLDQGNQF